MSDGFLGRWSKRKLEGKEGKEGKAVEVEPEQMEPQPPSPQPSPARARGGPVSPASERGGQVALAAVEAQEPVPAPSPPEGGGEGLPADKPPLTLEDVKALTAESDFSRFTASGVAPEVKNAALKKLFTDPRYNIMDGLDIYTGDYSQPDPMPESMLRQLASAKFLNLFDREEKDEAEAAEAARLARDVANNPTVQTVAQSETAPPAVPEPPDHADPDLRLQQDHAAPGPGPGGSAR